MNELTSQFKKAYDLQAKGQLPEAISLYEAILSKYPKHQESLHFLGLCYAQLGDMDNAIVYLAQAHQNEPKEPGILNNLGNAYKRKGLLDEALLQYQKALVLKPNYAQAHNNLATVYALKNNYTKALEHYAKAVNEEPDFSAAHFNLGLLLMHNNQLDPAKTQFKNVIALNPAHSEAIFYLGVLDLEANRLDEAEKAFHKVLECENKHIQSLINLGVIALKRNQNQTAVNYFSKALTFDDTDVDARNNLAATFMHHDRFENALMHYDVLIKNDPENCEYHYNSGVAQMALGHLAEAINHFEQVVNKQDKHTDALNNLAAIYIKMDKKEKAEEYLKQALAIHPNDSISQHMLNALTGSQSAQTTPEYAQNLFNNYSLYYDQHMKGPLHYSIPQHIGRVIHKLEISQVENCLDLGCGTGLSGIVLREISKKLTGVDIAEKMLQQAEEKHIYDGLIQEELTEFLTNLKEDFDLIVAADVLPYFSDLKTLFQLINAHLNPKGYFLFTIEISNISPWKLETTARFSHSLDYIQTLLKNNHLTLIHEEKVPGRMHHNKPLDLMMYACKKMSK